MYLFSSVPIGRKKREKNIYFCQKTDIHREVRLTNINSIQRHYDGNRMRICVYVCKCVATLGQQSSYWFYSLGLLTFNIIDCVVLVRCPLSDLCKEMRERIFFYINLNLDNLQWSESIIHSHIRILSNVVWVALAILNISISIFR